MLWGIRPGSWAEPRVTSGAQLGELENGVIVSQLLADKGVNIGDTITLDRVLTEFKVVGITAEANIGHIPIVYAKLPKWQEATYGPPGGMPPGEKFPDVVYDYVSVIALQLDPSLSREDIAGIDEKLGTATLVKVDASYRASTGYLEEVRSVSMIQYSLILIAKIVQNLKADGKARYNASTKDWYVHDDFLSNDLHMDVKKFRRALVEGYIKEIN